MDKSEITYIILGLFELASTGYKVQIYQRPYEINA